MKKKQLKPLTSTPFSTTHPQQVRLIGGQWKRTRLPICNQPGVRPTPDRVRETLFNWLQNLLSEWSQITCLDLFAGSGALGFEAASRGAQQVILVEKIPTIARHLAAIQEKLKAQHVQILENDAYKMLQNIPHTWENRFNLIFLDPPFNQGWLEKIIPFCKKLSKNQTLMYIEAENHLEKITTLWQEDWELIKSNQAGRVFYHLLRYKTPLEIQA